MVKPKAKPGKKDVCTVGRSCGEACISKSKECRKRLASQAAVKTATNFSGLIKQAAGGESKTKNVKFPHQGRHEYHKERRRVSDEEYKDLYGEKRVNKFNEALRRQLAKLVPVVYIDKEIVEKIKREQNSEDRRLKSVYEIGDNKLDPERKEDYIEERRTYEQQIVGYDKDVPDNERPIYATLQDPDNRDPLTMYGDTGYKIDVPQENYTITLGDSLTPHAPAAAPLDEVGLSQFSDSAELFDDVMGWEIGDMDENASDEEWDEVASRIIDQIQEEWNYMEIQIHQIVDIDKLEEL